MFMAEVESPSALPLGAGTPLRQPGGQQARGLGVTVAVGSAHTLSVSPLVITSDQI